jgi:hypothetical protein
MTDNPIPRGKYIGMSVGGPPADEAGHFAKCPLCGGWFDMRDLGQLLDHAGPHPAQDQPQ